MSDLEGLDEAALQAMLDQATSYEDRSRIRQVLRKIKRDSGRVVGRQGQRGASVYSRFRGQGSLPSTQASPKSFIITETSEQTKSATPAKAPARSERHTSSRGSVPVSSSPVARPPTPTPPSTPEQDEKPPSPPPEDEPDIPPYKEPSPSPSPPPSPPQALSPPKEPEEEEEEEEEMNEPDAREKEEEKLEEVNKPEMGEKEEEEEERGEEQETPPAPERKVSPVEAEEKALTSPKQKDHTPPRRGRNEPDSGSHFGVLLRSRQALGGGTSPRGGAAGGGGKKEEAKAEFVGFRLRRTVRDKETSRQRAGESKYDFGVKLKAGKPAATTDTLPAKQEEETGHRARAKTYASSRSTQEGKGGPKTIRDYQQIAAKKQNKPSRITSPQMDDEEEDQPTMAPDELQLYLVAYVNKELSLHPPLPARGKSLYDTCCNPTMLCKLINKSVPNTVDLRALTRISPSASPAEQAEDLKENMTLTVESARAIGCHVTDATADRILEKDPKTIRTFLVDLIRARVVHMPGMEDEPSRTFTNMATLFQKLNISVEDTVDGGDEGGKEGEEDQEKPSWRDDRETVKQALQSPPSTPDHGGSWRDTPTSPVSPPPQSTTEVSYEERAALRKAQREKRAAERAAAGDSGPSYEERAAQRRAEREKRRREREALATAK